jgi:hypothetical protein
VASNSIQFGGDSWILINETPNVILEYVTAEPHAYIMTYKIVFMALCGHFPFAMDHKLSHMVLLERFPCSCLVLWDLVNQCLYI